MRCEKPGRDEGECRDIALRGCEARVKLESIMSEIALEPEPGAILFRDVVKKLRVVVRGSIGNRNGTLGASHNGVV